MLIRHQRQTAEDLAAWERATRAHEVHAATKRHMDRVAGAELVVAEFAAAGPGYAGVSWGKDSTVLADLVWRVARGVPLVWVRVEPLRNPDCFAVRDVFLASHPGCHYSEVEVWCSKGPNGWPATGRLESGFALAAQEFGQRYLSGIRGAESSRRSKRVSRGLAYGVSTAPLGHWGAMDVFGYLHARGLPVHPAYACTMGGLLDSAELRVASLGGERGTGWGRAEWEARYYGRELAEVLRRGSERDGPDEVRVVGALPISLPDFCLRGVELVERHVAPEPGLDK